MNFVSVTADRNESFTKLTTKNGYLSTKSRHKEDHIQSLQADLCNLKVEAETHTTDMKINNKRVQTYAREKKNKPQWPTHPTEKIYNIKNYRCYHGYDTSDLHTLGVCKRTMVGQNNEAK